MDGSRDFNIDDDGGAVDRPLFVGLPAGADPASERIFWAHRRRLNGDFDVFLAIRLRNFPRSKRHECPASWYRPRGGNEHGLRHQCQGGSRAREVRR